MRIPTTLFAAVLCAAGLGMAQAQTSNVAPTGGSKIPAGISFAYDEAHGHLTTTGYEPAALECIFWNDYGHDQHQRGVEFWATHEDWVLSERDRGLD